MEDETGQGWAKGASLGEAFWLEKGVSGVVRFAVPADVGVGVEGVEVG